jgi:acyl-CoA thioester hydrolase
MSDPESTSRLPHLRSAYPHFRQVQTRWMDNDMYGHVNNVVYYAWFDSVITGFLIRECGLDIQSPHAVALYVVESACRYHRSLSYPETVDAGLRIGHLGTSSIRFELGLFREGEDKVAASGHFTVVIVDRSTNKPTPIPASIRDGLQRLTTSAV